MFSSSTIQSLRMDMDSTSPGRPGSLMTLDEILKRLAAASHKIESGGGVEVPDEDEEVDENMEELDLSGLCKVGAENSGDGESAGGSDMSDTGGGGKSKSRRRYKGKRRTSMAGRTWVKLEDVKAPRRPRSAYVLFLSTNRGKYGTTNQGASQSGINVALAGEWQGLSEEERKIYVDRANQERSDYEKEMETYKQTPHFYEFALKKSLIMKQRKMFRQAGLPTDQSGEEAILKLNKDELVTLQSALKSVRRNGKGMKLPSGMDFSSSSLDIIPKAENTDINIFSEAFLNYNKNREAELRSLRRSIGIAEDEQIGLKKSIQRLETDSENMTSEIGMEKDKLSQVDATMQLWLQIAVNALQQGLPNGNMFTMDNGVQKIQEAAVSEDATAQSLKEVLRSLSFPNPPNV